MLGWTFSSRSLSGSRLNLRVCAFPGFFPVAILLTIGGFPVYPRRGSPLINPTEEPNGWASV